MTALVVPAVHTPSGERLVACHKMRVQQTYNWKCFLHQECNYQRNLKLDAPSFIMCHVAYLQAVSDIC